jgi:predicted RNase H-like HicB family nuclease
MEFTMKLPIAIHKDPGSTYGVTVPDFIGCFSAGDTLDEAISNAGAAIYSHIATTLELGGTVDLKASHIDNLAQDKDYAGAIWALVDFDLSKLITKVERINITLPSYVLTKIDSFTSARPESRSGFLARAALALMAEESDRK